MGILSVFLVLILSLTAVNSMDMVLKATVKNQVCTDRGYLEGMLTCDREHVAWLQVSPLEIHG